MNRIVLATLALLGMTVASAFACEDVAPAPPMMAGCSAPAASCAGSASCSGGYGGVLIVRGERCGILCRMRQRREARRARRAEASCMAAASCSAPGVMYVPAASCSGL